MTFCQPNILVSNIQKPTQNATDPKNSKTTKVLP